MKAVDEAAYKAELKRFVENARKKGAKVILVTPMHRRTFDGSKITNSHRGFPASQARTELNRLDGSSIKQKGSQETCRFKGFKWFKGCKGFTVRVLVLGSAPGLRKAMEPEPLRCD